MLKFSKILNNRGLGNHHAIRYRAGRKTFFGCYFHHLGNLQDRRICRNGGLYGEDGDARSTLFYAAVLVELGGGLSLASGFRARYGALILALFLVPTTWIFHFSPAFGPDGNVVDRMQLLNGMKNLGLMGGLLLVYGNGAGRLTIGKDA